MKINKIDYKRNQTGQYKLRKVQVHGGEIKTALNYAKEKKRHHHNLKKMIRKFSCNVFEKYFSTHPSAHEYVKYTSGYLWTPIARLGNELCHSLCSSLNADCGNPSLSAHT